MTSWRRFSTPPRSASRLTAGTRSTWMTPARRSVSPTRLRLVPDDDELPSLRSDYDAMRAAAIVAEDAPAFDTLMEEIGDLEANVNVLAHPGRAKNGQSLETT